MRFDPQALIRIAEKNGITLERSGNNIVIHNSTPLWVVVLKMHKIALLKHLPKSNQKSAQVDLFRDL